jgi:hypothetical protein
MRVRELDKPANRWCPHCEIGEGCRIYAERPHTCRVFECVWLQTQRGRQPLALELRPDRSHVVMTTANAGEDIVLNVGPDRPDAWKRGAIGGLVARMLADGITVLVKCGARIERVQFDPETGAVRTVALARSAR